MPPDRRDGSLLLVDLVRRHSECADRFKRPVIRRGRGSAFQSDRAGEFIRGQAGDSGIYVHARSQFRILQLP
jgi:hypothetical protein